MTPEEMKAYKHNWYVENREKVSQQRKEWKAKNPEKQKQYRDKYYANNRGVINEYAKLRLRELRKEAIEYYSNGSNSCSCCGENHLEFLAIDHIDGGGNTLRKIEKNHGSTRWFKANNYPEGFRVLCHNCNMSLGSWGYCPHQG